MRRMVSDKDIALLEDLESNNINSQTISQLYIVDNIKAISGDILTKLKAGDIVLKNTNGQLHAYNVSFKKDGTGICLTYTDASVVETQSYDYTNGAWVYNSEDKTNLVNYTAGDNVSIVDGVISATDTKYTAGTNITISDSNVISASGGGKFYHHKVKLTITSGCFTTTGYSDYTIQIIMEMFTNSTSTPTYTQCFQNAKKEFMSGIIIDTLNTICYEIIDGEYTDFNLQNNGYIWINKDNVPTKLNLANAISSSANGHVVSLGYDEVNVQ